MGVLQVLAGLVVGFGFCTAVVRLLTDCWPWQVDELRRRGWLK